MILEVYTCTTWNICEDIILYITLAQPDFHYIHLTWFQGSTLAQPEIFVFMVKWHISLYTLILFTFAKISVISVAFSFLLYVSVLLHIHISYLYLCLTHVVATVRSRIIIRIPILDRNRNTVRSPINFWIRNTNWYRDKWCTASDSMAKKTNVGAENNSRTCSFISLFLDRWR